MIQPSEFLEVLKSNGYEILSGVPCSHISSLFHRLETNEPLQYIPATSEGEAVGIAAGSWLAGKKAAVICQNSGVGNMVNPLASLNHPYSLPTTLFVSMRGAAGFPDEPQHELMGRETKNILELLDVRTELLSDASDKVDAALQKANNDLLNGRSRAFLINPNTIDNPKQIKPNQMIPLEFPPAPIRREVDGAMVNRRGAIDILMQYFAEHVAVATTGHTCRELYATGDRANYFYMAGSMGHAVAVGLGIAINVSAPVIVLDGDGSLLMRMGACATVGKSCPGNLVHIVIDNGRYESTGGQCTNASVVDFPQIAQACGYRQIWQCAGDVGIERFCRAVDRLAGPVFAHIKVSSSEHSIPRPKMDMKQVAARMREFLLAQKNQSGDKENKR